MRPHDHATPRRTRGHIIADLSVNFVERYILEAGHVPHGIHRDYGYDLTVEPHAASGFAEAGHFFIQVKAAASLSLVGGRAAFFGSRSPADTSIFGGTSRCRSSSSGTRPTCDEPAGCTSNRT
jgi:hypothetical protein